jgi:predicted Zn-dependent protease
MKLILLCVLMVAQGVPAFAAALTPTHDGQVIERLPPAPPRMPQPDAAKAPSANAAATHAQALVDHARRTGDPRPAGQALAVLARWRDDRKADPAVVVALAQAEQHLHDFDAARSRLEALVAREPRHAQAWLMLATLHRVQGRYAASDRACDGVGAAGAALHASACRAENDALRGRHDVARSTLQGLSATARDASTRAWLATTTAELEQRAGRGDAAETAFRTALRWQPGDGYAALAFADLLIADGRHAAALDVLRDQPDSDAVLLRVAMADPARAASPAARTLRERLAQADQRPGASRPHARERAMFALHVQRDATAALRLARENVQSQREPLDLLLLAQSAQAARDAQAIAQAQNLVKETGLEDHRIHALR